MRMHPVFAYAAVALTAGCAQTGTGTTGATTQAAAESQCQYFVREERLVFTHINKVDAQGGGYSVNMRVQDALGRPFDATCVYASGKTTWAAPLPANISRRGEFK